MFSFRPFCRRGSEAYSSGRGQLFDCAFDRDAFVGGEHRFPFFALAVISANAVAAGTFHFTPA